jgi:hypothetical protein
MTDPELKNQTVEGNKPAQFAKTETVVALLG